ncbi:hypothetical protein PIB30_086479 [Stylosanthes scabra]|uniref:Uncharacterized protein n=1 Tax=Stylosanthes scabra TaxID=79078 RepID=A0ABU6WRG9_9FABA|nr:hypothetical protein [Stylosanthes scabra]
MEEAWSYGKKYNPWDPPPYQHHALQHYAYQSNGYSDAYYGYEDPPPPCPPSQIGMKETFQLLCQERKELHENQRQVNTQLTTLTFSVIRLVTQFRNEVHECLGDVEVENEEQEVEDVDQEVEDEDKEPKGMEIVHSISYGVDPSKLPSELHFEWANPSDMNFLGQQHYGLLEKNGQLKPLCSVMDKKEINSLVLDKSRFIIWGKSKLKTYSEHLQKLHNDIVKVGAQNLRKHLGPWQLQEKLGNLRNNGWTDQV